MQEEAESEAEEFHPETQEGYREEHGIPPIIDAEILEENGEEEGEEEGSDTEAMCRDILDLAGWEKVQINRQIAKSASEDAGLEGLLEKLQKALPKEYQEVMVVWHSVQADDEEEDEEAGSEEPAAEDSDEQEELF